MIQHNRGRFLRGKKTTAVHCCPCCLLIVAVIAVVHETVSGILRTLERIFLLYSKRYTNSFMETVGTACPDKQEDRRRS